MIEIDHDQHDATTRTASSWLARVAQARRALIAHAPGRAVDDVLAFGLDVIGRLADQPRGFVRLLTPSSGASAGDVLPGDAEAIATCVRRGEPVVGEHALVVPVVRDGAVVAVLGVGGRGATADAEAVEAVALMADILWEVATNLRPRHLADEVGEALVVHDFDGVILDVNAAACALYGRPRADMVGRALGDFATPGARGQIAERMALLRRDERIRFDNITVRADGTVVHTDVLARLVSSEGRGVVYGVVRDITARRVAESALRESEAKHRQLFEHMQEGFSLNEVITDERGEPVDFRILEANAAYERHTGFAVADALGKTILELLPRADRRHIARLGRVALTGEPQVFEYYSAAFGRHLRVRAFRPQPGRFATVFEDVTDRKVAEQELRDSRALLFNAMHSSPLLMTISDLETGRYLDVNESFCRISGFARDEAIGKTSVELGWVSAAERARMVGALQQDGRIQGIELALRTKGGTPVVCKFWGDVIETRDGPRLFSTAEDITDRQRAERERDELQAQLLQAQKMEAVGQLAGGIAHDFNNILAAMMMQLDLLRRAREVSLPELRSVVVDLLASANRAAALTKQLLLFGRRQPLSIARHDASVVVRELARLLGRLIGEHVELVVDLDPSPLWFEGDAGLIGQALTNLCVNARDAMPRGGRITIETRGVTLDEDAARRRRGARPGELIRLRVTDTGDGIGADVLPHIFEPFFTTKPVGQGTGLGLATVDGVVAKHGGWVEVDSEVGVGTTFSLYLPRTAAAGEAASEPPAARVRGGNEHVLVVEDEETVRRVAVLCLRQLGYEVSEAASGAEALRRWETRPGALDLLLTDMVMPGGVSGVELCARLRVHRPDLPAIIATGYSSAIVDAEPLGGRGIVFLQKPYDVEVLAAAVRGCLDGAATATATRRRG